MEFCKDQKMPITRKIEDKNLIVTVQNDRVSHHAIMQAFDELPKITPNLSEMYELVIITDNIKSDLTNERNQKVIDKAARVYKNFKSATISIVCPTGFSFRFAKQFVDSIVNEKVDVSVFRTEESARKWIDEIRSFHIGIDNAYPKKYSENPEACFQLSADSYKNAKRLLNFSKCLVAQKHFSPATAVATLGAEEAIKSYELLFSSLDQERQKSLSLYLKKPIKKSRSVEPIQQSVVIFEIILQLVNDLIDKYKNDPPADISKLLSEIPLLIQKRLLDEKMT
jgi:hypothetical protein